MMTFTTFSKVWVVNHGVSERLRGLMLSALEAFFDLPDKEKTKYTEKKVLDPIQFGTGFNPAAEEVRYWRDFLKVIVHPEFNSPAKPPGFSAIGIADGGHKIDPEVVHRELLQKYTTSTRELARELLKGIWESLQLEISYIDDVLELDSCFEIFAVLLQNGIDVLQVNHNGRWVNVKALPNSFFINTGDHIEVHGSSVWSHRYKDQMHADCLILYL